MQKCRLLSPSWPYAHQTWRFSCSELAGCYGENINFLLSRSEGKPRAWPLKRNYPASRGLVGQKEGEDWACTHKTSKHGYVCSCSFRQRSLMLREREQLFSIPCFSLYTLPLGDVWSSHIVHYPILLFLTVGSAFFSVLVNSRIMEWMSEFRRSCGWPRLTGARKQRSIYFLRFSKGSPSINNPYEVRQLVISQLAGAIRENWGLTLILALSVEYGHC